MSQYQNVKVVNGQANVTVDGGYLDTLYEVTNIFNPVTVRTTPGTPLETTPLWDGARALYTAGSSPFAFVGLQACVPLPGITLPALPLDNVWLDARQYWQGSSTNGQTLFVPGPGAGERGSFLPVTSLLDGTADVPYPCNPVVWRFSAYAIGKPAATECPSFQLRAGRVYWLSAVIAVSNVAIETRPTGGAWTLITPGLGATQAAWYQKIDGELRVTTADLLRVAIVEYEYVEYVTAAGTSRGLAPGFTPCDVNGLVIGYRDTLRGGQPGSAGGFQNYYSYGVPIGFSIPLGVQGP